MKKHNRVKIYPLLCSTFLLSASLCPLAIPASAAAAYKGYGSVGSTVNEEEFQKADFSHILEGIKREDGFSRDENVLDSDGLPVTHKTKHVMNALFGPTKVSPILRVKLDEDDDDI